MIARRDTRSATTPPISRHTSCAPVRAASTMPIEDAEPSISEHREGERDRDHPVAEPRDRGGAEQPPEGDVPQDVEVLGQARHDAAG